MGNPMHVNKQIRQEYVELHKLFAHLPDHFVLELFAGSAGLSSAFIEMGVPAIGVDGERNRFRMKAPVVQLDVTKAEHRKFLLELIVTRRPGHVHMAPPCGTSSRARDKQVPKRLRAQGAPNPPPLRSEEHPNGLPSLTGLNKEKVVMANILYLFCTQVANLCIDTGVGFTIENPTNSYMWMTAPFVGLLSRPEVLAVEMDLCMHGSARNKSQKLVTNCPEVNEMSKKCDASHTHLSWGAMKIGKKWHFATKDECAYPVLWCKNLVKCLLPRIKAQNLKNMSENRAKTATSTNMDLRNVAVPGAGDQGNEQLARAATSSTGAGSSSWQPFKARPAPRTEEEKRALAEKSAAVGTQARGTRFGRLLPEYKRLMSVFVSPAEASTLPARGESVITTIIRPGSLPDIPEGATRLASPLDEIGSTAGGTPGLREVVFGIPWNPEEFLEAAKRLSHPFDSCDATPDAIRRSVFETLTRGSDHVKNERRAALEKWTRRAQELESAEAELHKGMDPELAKVYSGKRFLLLKEMLEAIQYPDKKLLEDLIKGMPLVGWLEATGAFEPRMREPLHDEEWLKQTKSWAKAHAAATVRADPDAVVQKEIERKTAKEVANHWASGPYTRSQVTEILGEDWYPSRRFGVTQGDSVRVIDDYSAYWINALVGTAEKINLGGIDEIAAMIRTWISCSTNGIVSVTLSTGERLEAPLHSDFGDLSARALVGKCVDLESAYRQVGILPSHRRFAVFATWNDSRKVVEFYIAAALPFGSVAAVTGFNRPARGLCAILSRLFGVCISNYFDDYPLLEAELLKESAEEVVSEVLKLLGWKTKAEKNVPFAECFAALGVVFDLEDIAKSRCLVVKNKKERVTKIRAQLEKALRDNELTPSEAQELRSKLSYASSQLLGRCGAWASLALSERATRGNGPWAKGLTPELRTSLSWWIRFLSDARPRTIPLSRGQIPVLIFTDGAYEEKTATHGGMMLDRADGRCECFGAVVPERLADHWRDRGRRRQLIAQAELYPAIVSRQLWGDTLSGRRILHFVDNEGARESLVKGRSPSRACAALLECFWTHEVALNCLCWFERVPSKGNPGDAPSRLDFRADWLRGAVERAVPAPPACLFRS